MDSEEKKKPQNFCLICGEPSAPYRPFLCVKHDRELEKLKKKYYWFSREIRLLYVDKKLPVLEVLEFLIEECDKVKALLEKDCMEEFKKRYAKELKEKCKNDM